MEQFNETAVHDKTETPPRLAIFDPDTRLTPAPRAEGPAEKPARKRKQPGKSKVKATPDYPLWQRADGRWCRKIKGRVHYFGTDRDAALEEWERVKADLLAGRAPRPKGDGLLLKDLCNRFLTAKTHLLDNREIGQRTFDSYKASAERLVAAFGGTRLVDDINAGDFEQLRQALSDGRGPVTLRGDVLNIRMIFKFGYDSGILPSPARFGQSFKVPSKTVLRKARQAGGRRLFDASELRKIIREADQPLRAMILLGINAGFGATDLSCLPQSALDLSAGWCDFPRPKTAVERRCPLWPETIKAIREAIAQRKEPRDPADAGLVFLTRCGQRWVRVSATGPVDAVACEMTKLLKGMGIKRERVGFYALRHTLQTVGGGARDQIALNSIFGHADGSQAAAYREGIDDARLLAVSNYVRAWLFPVKGKPR